MSGRKSLAGLYVLWGTDVRGRLACSSGSSSGRCECSRRAGALSTRRAPSTRSRTRLWLPPRSSPSQVRPLQSIITSKKRMELTTIRHAATVSLGAGFELVDMSNHLPGLVYRPGLTTWRPTVSREINTEFTTYEKYVESLDESERASSKMLESHWPPSPEEAENIGLTRWYALIFCFPSLSGSVWTDRDFQSSHLSSPAGHGWILRCDSAKEAACKGADSVQ